MNDSDDAPTPAPPPPGPAGASADEPGAGGLAQVLRVAMPLVISSAAMALRLFADRMMLTHYSAEAIAAAMPAGLTHFCLLSFFMGMAGYASTFVAQYVGARQAERTGLAIWQSMYLALAGGALLATGVWWAPSLFALYDHAPAVVSEEIVYFRILVAWSVFPMLAFALSGFWSGRGQTLVVMAVSFVGTAVNVTANYLLIFGTYGAPELGIAGAAWGTVLSAAAEMILYLALFLRRPHRAAFGTWPSRTFDPALLLRLVRYGLPNGVQFFLDITSFNVFVIILGRLGPTVQEASNIAFGINVVVFLPMIGLGMAAGILVGQAVGAGDIPLARRSVASARTLLLLYVTGTILMQTVGAPWILPFFRREDGSDQTTVLYMAQAFLCFISLLQLFDGLCILYHNAIKGAGDTLFAMVAGVSMSWLTLALPTWALWRAGAGVWWLWTLLVAHVGLVALVYGARFFQGAWERMRVIE